MAEKPDNKVSFKDTLNLPRTDFPIRSNAKEDDPAMIKRWESEHLYEKAFFAHQGSKRFIFHDGPPYANGNIHLGSAYNKILKDISCKSRRMSGMQVPVTPGWDCHGLPIELKVTKEQPGLSREELIKACRAYAKKWIDIQRQEFKGLGVVMNWDYPYLTMNYEYEAKELRALAKFVANGYVNRSNKTVPWCISCKTVLATAEIEYADRKDPSIYVFFPLTDEAIAQLKLKKGAGLAVWTTTPWTLPLNRAVMAKPGAHYVVLDINGRETIIGKELADALCAHLEIEEKVIKELKAEDFFGLKARHCFIEGLEVPLILDDAVLLDEGTAFVHSAPGAGPIDYEIGIKNNLEIFSPVNPDGTYDKTIQPKELEGMSVVDGQIWVIKKLAERGGLIYKTSVRHSYPHCWRCRNGLIFRATKQWFFSLTNDDLRKRAIAATETINTLPSKSINRLQSTIESRFEWCISRQRAWGVPIPALICEHCDHTYITPAFIDTVAQGVEKQGVEYWQSVSVAELAQGIECSECKENNFRKEHDILDVWFDSGLSHYAVLYDNPELGYPADLYLEGKDQHRGWFQSSLLTSMALEKEPAMKMIITHGFTVDDKGVKMSKSLGNVVAPHEIIEKIGTDGLRLWASSIDFSSEAIVSENLLKNVQELFRKVRNTSRFLLSNLYDFDIDTNALPLEKLRIIDQYALQELVVFNDAVLNAYKRYDFTQVFQLLGNYCSVNLSTFYFEIVKDSLYVEKADGRIRRSVQTALWHILDTLTKLSAPILSFTAEQVSDLYQKDKKESIHLQVFNDLETLSIAQSPEGLWDTLKDIRSAILKATESLREQSIIKRSLDSRVTFFIDPSADYAQSIQLFFEGLANNDEKIDEFLKEFAIVSQIERADTAQGLEESSLPGLYLKVEKARGEKCPRCWQWSQTDHEHQLCSRCQKAL